MPRAKAPTTYDGALATMVQSLRQAAQRPSIHGYHPMEHQEKFHRSRAVGRAFFGGNRSGKTVGGATEACWWLSGKHPYQRTPEPPVRLRGVASDWPHGLLQIMLPELARWIPPSLLIDGSWEKSYNKTEKVLTLENGSTMDFPTHEMPLIKHAGTSRHAIWFDEEPPKSIFNENMARLVDTQGKWWLTETPTEGMTWVYDDIYLRARNDSQIFTVVVSMDDNIYLSQNEIELLLSFMGDDEREARRKGKFVQIGGVIYKGFGPENLLPKIPVDSDAFQSMIKSWTFFCMMDHGFNNPTAWVWAAVNHEGKVIVFDEHYESQQVVSYHAEVVKERNLYWGIEPAYNVGDPSIAHTDPITGTSVQIEYAIRSVPILPGNNDVSVGLQVVAQAFKDKQLYFTTNCEKTIWEHGRYRWATWSNRIVAERKNVRDEPNKKDDHSCDAVRYGMCSRPEHIEKIVAKFDTLAGLAPSLPPSGERYAVIEDNSNNYTDQYVGSEF